MQPKRGFVTSALSRCVILLSRPLLLNVALIGQCRHSLSTDTLRATLRIAKRIYSLAQEQNEACAIDRSLLYIGNTHYFCGNFEACGQYATRGVKLWRGAGERSPVDAEDPPEVACLCCEALFKWHNNEITSAEETIEEAVSLLERLPNKHALAVAFHHSVVFAYFKRNPAEVEHLAAILIELSTAQNFGHWLAVGKIYRGWARSASGDIAQGVSLIEKAIDDHRNKGAILGLTCALALKAEALHFADRTTEALETLREAETLAETRRERWWRAELHRLRGVFLTALGADQAEIETAFRKAIGTAGEQKSILLTKRAEATYAEYRSQKATSSGGSRPRLPLC